MSKQIVETQYAGKPFNLRKNDFTEVNRMFDGWNEDATATTIQYKDQEECTFYEDKVLYAIWKDIPLRKFDVTTSSSNIVFEDVYLNGTMYKSPKEPLAFCLLHVKTPSTTDELYTNVCKDFFNVESSLGRKYFPREYKGQSQTYKNCGVGGGVLDNINFSGKLAPLIRYVKISPYIATKFMVNSSQVATPVGDFWDFVLQSSPSIIAHKMIPSLSSSCSGIYGRGKYFKVDMTISNGTESKTLTKTATVSKSISGWTTSISTVTPTTLTFDFRNLIPDDSFKTVKIEFREGTDTNYKFKAALNACCLYS